ncbi:MAG: SDR family NAD(P)-dependent oxidoreductase [Infirmifilum sp.]
MLNAVITGASSGIGWALVKELSAKGAYVLGTGRNRQALAELKKMLGERFEYTVCDLANLSCVDEIARKASERFSTLDVLVNNAGYGVAKNLSEMMPEETYAMVMVNLAAPLALTQRLLPTLHPGSTVVNVETAGIHVLMNRLPLYGATKIALHYASKALRRELQARGVRLLEVFPGVVDTPFHERAGLPASLKGVSAEKVAREIVNAIEGGKEKLYIPWYMGILRIFGPYLPAIY